ncbi:MAG TPA: pyridoxamine 5'-phosphate oxidase family protein [Acidimicrobiales bacterium]|nr:pyridoxamine 5'-phosphate oxidase family protein [Acidimicrobiales bacterium]
MEDAAVVLPPADPSSHLDRSEVLTPEQCWEHLRASSVGRVAFVVDGWPVVLPVNYAIAGSDIVLRSGPGSKLTAARRTSQVSLQVDAIDVVYRSGWSVLLFGTAETVADPSEIAGIDDLGLRTWAATEHMEWIRIHPVSVTGRALPRAWRYPGAPE